MYLFARPVCGDDVFGVVSGSCSGAQRKAEVQSKRPELHWGWDVLEWSIEMLSQILARTCGKISPYAHVPKRTAGGSLSCCQKWFHQILSLEFLNIYAINIFHFPS